MQQLQNIRVLRFFRGLCFLSVDFVKKFRRWYTRSKRNSVREDGRCLCEILSWAVYLGRNDICKYVVKEAVDLSVRVIGKSPLHRAVFYDREDTTKLFVSISCRTNIVNLKDDFGLSPLFWSLLLERHDIAEYLVSKRADVQETCTVRPALNRKFFLRARWMFSYLKMQYTPSIKTRLLTHMCLLASPAVSANGDCLFAWRGPISHVSSAWYVRLFSCRLKVPATLLASVLSFYMSQKYNNAKWRAGQPLERPYQRLF